jgi:2-oxoglutarate dehydrogenase E1 component
MSQETVIPGCDNLAFVEDLYSSYLQNAGSVPQAWQTYFGQMLNGDRATATSQIGPSFSPPPLFGTKNGQNGSNAPSGANGNATNGHASNGSANRVSPDGKLSDHDLQIAIKQEKVTQLVRNYRMRGHLFAKVNPLGDRAVTTQTWRDEKHLDPQYFGFTDDDLNTKFSTVGIGGADVLTLKQLLERLQNTYCRNIGVQFMHIDNVAEREWLQNRMEVCENHIALNNKQQFRILTRLTDAWQFEEFLKEQFPQVKTFSLKGAETLIPLLDLTIEKAGEQGIEEIVMAMAHRGRLNVLANVLAKDKSQIFREIKDLDGHLYERRGDVKYHLGHSRDWITTTGKKVHLSLCFNPSHLEFVNPVAVGRARAKQDRKSKTLALQIHGDAAFAGEGVIQETLNLSQLPAYETGGSLHIIINNQVGFTTDPDEGRSTQYCTDVCKMLQIPIFHVNGEDPEAVAQVVNLAMDFRAAFTRDVVIDMYCYRYFGHNEQDQPRFTQPLMYKQIDEREGVRESYLDHLITLGGVTIEQAEWIKQRTQEDMEEQLERGTSSDFKPKTEHAPGVWSQYRGGADKDTPDVDTGVPVAKLSQLLKQISTVPEGFKPHDTIKSMVLAPRLRMAEGTQSLNWGAAELLAYATLASTGTPVRLSGQDCGRGTFSHRQAVLHDQNTNALYCGLQHISKDQGKVEIYNSPLSEVAVMGFEYGYSLDFPRGLALWEAQFGDFCNVAQVIIDQFIVSAEEKWRRLSGLVLLLPHGYEGQGPEHSSARLERFLALCAEDNIQVAQPTTPAQIFHLLRRQVMRSIRKPLVVMTPKSLLRLPAAASPLSDLSTGTFQRILPDKYVNEQKKTRRILLCSGKIYYELADEREKLNLQDVAILRVEQLYPLRAEHMQAALAPYAKDTPVFWVQEEPENMGAWWYMRIHFGEKLLGQYPFSVVARAESASPATGSHTSHHNEQHKILEQAFAGLK